MRVSACSVYIRCRHIYEYGSRGQLFHPFNTPNSGSGVIAVRRKPPRFSLRPRDIATNPSTL